MTAAPAIDHEALLVALVIAPATYSRNRFFELYRNPEIRRVRRRAAQIRSVIAQVADTAEGALRESVRVAPANGNRVELAFEVPALGLYRRTLLEPLELALVRVAVERGGRARDFAELSPSVQDRICIDDALSRLAPLDCQRKPGIPPRQGT